MAISPKNPYTDTDVASPIYISQTEVREVNEEDVTIHLYPDTIDDDTVSENYPSDLYCNCHTGKDCLYNDNKVQELHREIEDIEHFNFDVIWYNKHTVEGLQPRELVFANSAVSSKSFFLKMNAGFSFEWFGNTYSTVGLFGFDVSNFDIHALQFVDAEFDPDESYIYARCTSNRLNVKRFDHQVLRMYYTTEWIEDISTLRVKWYVYTRENNADSLDYRLVSSMDFQFQNIGPGMAYELANGVITGTSDSVSPQIAFNASLLRQGKIWGDGVDNWEYGYLPNFDVRFAPDLGFEQNSWGFVTPSNQAGFGGEYRLKARTGEWSAGYTPTRSSDGRTQSENGRVTAGSIIDIDGVDFLFDIKTIHLDPPNTNPQYRVTWEFNNTGSDFDNSRNSIFASIRYSDADGIATQDYKYVNAGSNNLFFFPGFTSNSNGSVTGECVLQKDGAPSISWDPAVTTFPDTIKWETQGFVQNEHTYGDVDLTWFHDVGMDQLKGGRATPWRAKFEFLDFESEINKSINRTFPESHDIDYNFRFNFFNEVPIIRTPTTFKAIVGFLTIQSFAINPNKLNYQTYYDDTELYTEIFEFKEIELNFETFNTFGDGEIRMWLQAGEWEIFRHEDTWPIDTIIDDVTLVDNSEDSLTTTGKIKVTRAI